MIFNSSEAKEGNATFLSPVNETYSSSNNQIVLLPKFEVTKAGHINNNIWYGSYTTINASDLTDGTMQISADGTYDVTNYKNVEVSTGGGGGSVELTNISVHHSTTFYTDSTMTARQGNALVNVSVPIGSIVFGYGKMEPGKSNVGVTQMATYSRGTYVVYKVTG